MKHLKSFRIFENEKPEYTQEEINLAQKWQETGEAGTTDMDQLLKWAKEDLSKNSDNDNENN